MARLSPMGRHCFHTASQEQLALRLAPVFSKIFETLVDPYSLVISAAEGYWAHNHQDCMRFTGHYRTAPPYIDFGSWDLTVSYAAALPGIAVLDNRHQRRRDCDFEVVKLKTVAKDDVFWAVPKLP